MTAKLQASINPRTMKTAKWLADNLSGGNLTRVTEEALDLYVFLYRELRAGSKIIIRSKHGEDTHIVLPVEIRIVNSGHVE